MQIEGPYWKPLSPERTRLREPDTKGEPILITGHVYNQAGAPIDGAWLDFWHCDGEANYDNKGYRLRGHQFTGPDGRYRLETVIPSEYDDFLTSPDGETRKVYRTSHIHVKVKGPERMTLPPSCIFQKRKATFATVTASTTCCSKSKIQQPVRWATSISSCARSVPEQSRGS
jgi:protocatechuate 3,4-dioxygenase beta subunit